MQYELRVWNDPKKMPDIQPHQEKGSVGMASRLGAIKVAAENAFGQNNHGNPDILIDADGAGEDAIKSAEVSFFLQKLKIPELRQPLNIRLIRMKIHGNLYLPLKESDLTKAAKSMAGINANDEHKKRDTLLLSQWANVTPPIPGENKSDYYRGVVLSVLTKAGDFRVVTAKNVYVENYSENYAEGEFGTFELTLVQRIDVPAEFKVDGLSSETQGVLDQIKGALNSKAAKKFTETAEAVATAGAVLKVGSSIVKKGVETYEKFNGETEVTKRLKYGLDTAGAAGDMTGNAANIAKSVKNDKGTDRIKNISNEISKANDTLNDDIQKGADVGANGGTVSLEQLEAAYLAGIKKSPDAYRKYLESSYEDKRKMLNEYAQKGLDRAAITKAYEASQIDVDKSKKVEEDLKDHKIDGKVDGKPIDAPTTDNPTTPNPAVIPIPTVIPIPMPTPMPTPTPTNQTVEVPVPIPTPVEVMIPIPVTTNPPVDKQTNDSSKNQTAYSPNGAGGVSLTSGGLSSQISSAAMKKSNGNGNGSK